MTAMEKVYHRLAEKDLRKMLHRMRYSEDKFYEIQKKRVIRGALMLLLTIFLSLFSWVYGVFGLILTVVQWMSQYRSIKGSYRNFIFKQQLNFSKFARMLIPYLYEDGATLYSVFNRLLNRLEESYVKQCLERLIIDMNNHPNSAIPFKEFGETASGTDEGVLFMHTLHDYQQNSFDRSIIQELGRMASEDLFKGIDEIIAFKLRKFNLFPTKLTMINLIIVMGYMLAVFMDLFKDILPK